MMFARVKDLTGDLLRLVVKSTITTAKQVYTNTKIALNPVSVVSLAERELRIRKLRIGCTNFDDRFRRNKY